MCDFFSCVSDGNGNIYYFDAKQRKILEDVYDFDSHTSIAHYYGFKYEKEDKLNKWEYDPISNNLVCDQLNTWDDGNFVREQLSKIDFNKFKEMIKYNKLKSLREKYLNKKVKLSVKFNKEPEFGWGGVTNGEVGIVKEVRYNSLDIDFPSQSYWTADFKEVKLIK